VGFHFDGKLEIVKDSAEIIDTTNQVNVVAKLTDEGKLDAIFADSVHATVRVVGPETRYQDLMCESGKVFYKVS